MNARAVTTDVLLGIVPIALLVALWQAIASFGYAPASLGDFLTRLSARNQSQTERNGLLQGLRSYLLRGFPEV